MTATATRSEAFGSALSVAEYALLTEAQITPLRAVTGCEMSWLSITPPIPAAPPKRAAWSGSATPRYPGDVLPVSDLDTALTEARRGALRQLRADAEAAGANAVVGVRRIFTGMPAASVAQAARGFLQRHHLAQGLVPINEQLEYQFIGTAVRDPAIKRPGTHETMVGGAQYTALRRAGWEPAGMVGGCSHQVGVNLSSFTLGEAIGGTAIWEAARAAARAQLRSELEALDADGAIELQVTTRHADFELPERLSQSIARSSGVTLTMGVLVTVEMLAAAIRHIAAETPPAPPKQLVILR